MRPPLVFLGSSTCPVAIQSTSIVVGNESHSGTLTTNGLITAKGGINMGTSLITLELPIAIRSNLNLGYMISYSSFASTVYFGASNAVTNFWSFSLFPIGIWLVNIKLQFNVLSTTSNITVMCGTGVGTNKQYGVVNKPTSISQQTTICLNSILATSSKIANVYVSGTATYSAGTPNLIGLDSSIIFTRIG